MADGAGRARSRREYARRMHRVLEHVDRQLDAPLDLATLAGVAHFSPFHFLRLFAAYVGETPGDDVRRRRLEVAATRLAAQPSVPVLDIALSVGFGSTEAFAHAFKARFGTSATAWRRARVGERLAERKRDQAVRSRDQAIAAEAADDDGSSIDFEVAMQVELIERTPVRIAYLRYTGPYGPPLAAFWRSRVMPWLDARGLRDRPLYGVSHDNPNVTAPEKCRCDVGVAIDDGFVPVGDEQVTTIPGGRYAAAAFVGTVADLGPAWTALLRDWLPASGLQLDARPMFEYMGPGTTHDAATGVFGCAITVPVMPL